jgi:hypothetical protein
MIDEEKLIAWHLEVLGALGWTPPSAEDFFVQFARGEYLDSDEAGIVGGRDGSTAVRWAQAAEDVGAPIALKIGKFWLFITRRLLDNIEKRFGLHARREAETRHRKLLEMRGSEQGSTLNASGRAAMSREPCENSNKTAIEQDPIRLSRAV